jgi:hypothetical protein
MMGRGLIKVPGIDGITRAARVGLADRDCPDPGAQDQLPVREGDGLFAPVPGVRIGRVLWVSFARLHVPAVTARGPEIAGDQLFLQIAMHDDLLDEEDSPWLSSPSVRAL